MKLGQETSVQRRPQTGGSGARGAGRGPSVVPDAPREAGSFRFSLLSSFSLSPSVTSILYLDYRSFRNPLESYAFFSSRKIHKLLYP